MPADVVRAILDRQIAQEDLVDKALADAAPIRASLKLSLRAILAKGLPEAEARAAFRQVVYETVLAGTASHVPAALGVVRRAVVAEARAVKALGSRNLVQVPALRKADVMARRAEQAGLAGKAGGEKPNG